MFQVTFERELSIICEGFPFVEPNTASRISHLLGYGVDPNISDDVRKINIASWNIINFRSLINFYLGRLHTIVPGKYVRPC